MQKKRREMIRKCKKAMMAKIMDTYKNNKRKSGNI